MLKKKGNKEDLGFRYYTSTVIKTMWYCYINRQTSDIYQESQNINWNTYENLKRCSKMELGKIE